MQGTIAIIGAGRVSRGLGHLLRELDWEIGSVVAQSEANARRAVRFIGGGRARCGMPTGVLASNVILIAVPDRVIADVAKELARIGAEELKGKTVLHTSGAVDSSVLKPVREFGAAVASMHPLQTFSGVGVPSLQGKIFAIEGDESAVRLARRMARSLGGVPVQIAAGDKPLYHASAALAAGHVLAIVEAAVRLLMSSGPTRKESLRALLPLTRQVLDNYERLGPKTAWTGPLSRGDYGVIATHVQALEKFSPEYRQAYESLNRLAALVLSQDRGECEE